MKRARCIAAIACCFAASAAGCKRKPPAPANPCVAAVAGNRPAVRAVRSGAGAPELLVVDDENQFVVCDGAGRALGHLAKRRDAHGYELKTATGATAAALDLADGEEPVLHDGEKTFRVHGLNPTVSLVRILDREGVPLGQIDEGLAVDQRALIYDGAGRPVATVARVEGGDDRIAITSTDGATLHVVRGFSGLREAAAFGLAKLEPIERLLVAMAIEPSASR